jgi:hypothetical protein
MPYVSDSIKPASKLKYRLLGQILAFASQRAQLLSDGDVTCQYKYNNSSSPASALQLLSHLMEYVIIVCCQISFFSY